MIEDVVNITGTLSALETIHATLSVTEGISGTITLPDHVSVDHYEGVYEVTPSFDIQTLETNGLLMDDDVTVEAIYVSRTTNPSGGTTVYIGGDIL